MQKDELSYIKKHYANLTFQHFCNNTVEADSIVNLVDKAVSFDSPDFYCIDNNICYVFEHFAFDGAEIKGGSQYRVKSNKVGKAIDKQVKTAFKNAPQDEIATCGVISQGCDTTYTKENYRANFQTAFNSHYAKLGQYKDKLIANNIITVQTKIVNVFFIEDTTEFGGSHMIDGKRFLLVPYCFDFCVETVKSAPQVKYFVFANKSQKRWVIVNRNKYLKQKDGNADFDKAQVWFFPTVQTLSAPIYIPQQMINKK